MKYLASFIVLLFFCSFLSAQDFRNVSWGMSKEDVLKNEQAPKIESARENAAYYQVKINNYDLTLEYIFQDDKLGAADYSANWEDMNYLTAYQKLKTFFIRIKDTLDVKYGEAENPNQNEDPFFFYKSGSPRKYVNYDLDSFLDPYETNNTMLYKLDILNMANIGYTYCLNYKTRTTIISLFVVQNLKNLNVNISYIPPQAYKYLNDQTKKQILEKSEGL